jgi:hypothetical protein
MSSISTSIPALAKCEAMPLPMTPAPMTPTRLIGLLMLLKSPLWMDGWGTQSAVSLPGMPCM